MKKLNIKSNTGQGKIPIEIKRRSKDTTNRIMETIPDKSEERKETSLKNLISSLGT